MFKAREFFDSIYPADSPARRVLLLHSLKVAALANYLNRCRNLGLDERTVSDAALLHDIGIGSTDAPGIHCFGSEPYLAHGAIGADMLRRAGAPEQFAAVAERHTGTGLTPNEIDAQNLPLPSGRDYMPRTVLERLICYADCYYSKTGAQVIKSRERILTGLQRFGDGVARRFLEMEKEFGTPEGFIDTVSV